MNTNTISFDRLLLKTAFFCMAADGEIHQSEVAVIKSLCESSSLFTDFNFNEEINALIDKINTKGNEYISYYFGLLRELQLSEDQELVLLDFAIKTIQADGVEGYSEVKLVKAIRKSLKISNEKILSAFPNAHQFIEEDAIAESNWDNIVHQYLTSTKLPQFNLLT
jgi:uncharacterized tellurite resistance protein B-like protein